MLPFAWIRDRTALPETWAYGGNEVSTARLRALIVERAKAWDPDVVVYEDYRAKGGGVPLLLVFPKRTVGVWAYGNDSFNMRHVDFRPCHAALDAALFVGHAYWPLQDCGIPAVVEFGAWNDEGEVRISYREDPEMYHRQPQRARPDIGNASDALALLRTDERIGLPDDAGMRDARAFVRQTLRARPRETQRMDERAILPAAREHISAAHFTPGTIVEELPLSFYADSPDSRGRRWLTAFADLAYCDPAGVHAYEIKGETDSLVRLPNQVLVYGALATSATLFCAEKHVQKAQALLPAWWGLVEVSGSSDAPQLRVLRSGATNPDCQARHMLLNLLAPELAELTGRARNGSKSETATHLAQTLSLPAAAFHFGHYNAIRPRSARASQCLRVREHLDWEPYRPSDAAVPPRVATLRSRTKPVPPAYPEDALRLFG